MSYVLAFLGFAVLIILHEAGHFAAAKAVGMRVERFSLFFGPLLLKFRRGETEYGIAAIPLGGYVRITGMSPREEIAPEVLPRAYFNQPVWKRVVVILAGPAVNLILAFAILFGVYWADGATPTSKVASSSLEAPASRYLHPGDRIVRVDAIRNPSVDQISTVVRSHRCPGKLSDGCRAATPVTMTVKRDGSERSFTVYPVYDAGNGFMRLGFMFDVAAMG